MTARIQAGATILNLANARACLDRESQRFDCSSSTMTTMVFPECDSTLLYGPGHSLGGSCLYRYDCIDGLCSRANASCGGTCQPYRQIGETCNTSDQFCDPETSYCDYGFCAPLKSAGSDCAATWECAPGSTCWGPSGYKVCTPMIPAGAACSPGQPCVSGYRCGGANGTCVPLYSGQVGHWCTSNEGCQWGLWCDGGSSYAFGTCSAVSPTGTPCTAAVECGWDSFCSSTCQPRRDAGLACQRDFECKWGLVCRNGSCVALGSVGAACSADNECQRFLRCVGGTCSEVPGGFGQTCSSDAVCAAGYWCSGGVCTPQAAAGDYCVGNGACLSGDCENGVCRPNCSY